MFVLSPERLVIQQKTKTGSFNTKNIEKYTTPNLKGFSTAFIKALFSSTNDAAYIILLFYF
jgi:hypothetical protein